MQSTINNANNSNNASAFAFANTSECDKNEHYTEFGLAKGQKRDSKARSFLAVKQTEEREKKVAEQISQLPKKLQAKLAQEVVSAPPTGKTKTALKTKPFYDRRNKATQAMLLDDYAEQCVAEDDAQNEVWKAKGDAIYEAYCEEMAKEEAELTAKWEADEHYNDYERAREEEEEDEGYKAGLALWLRYGLTKAQYDANREYESNVKALNAFYRELDYQSHPDYENRLIAAIKKYEDDFDAEQREQDLKDEQNEWWIDPEMANEDCFDDFDNREVESYEDWLERQEEDRIQSQRENAIDDMRDDD
jgi:hypothetical protein